MMMKVVVFLTLISSTAAIFGIGIGRKQAAGARGQLLCGGKPVNGVKIKLYDDDRGVDTDDLMGTTTTTGDGHFELQGYTHELTSIDPKINIYHDCNDALTPCQRKLTIMIPDKYISSGEDVEKFFNVGVIELEGIFKGEERDCLH